MTVVITDADAEALIKRYASARRLSTEAAGAEIVRAYFDQSRRTLDDIERGLDRLLAIAAQGQVSDGEPWSRDDLHRP